MTQMTYGFHGNGRESFDNIDTHNRGTLVSPLLAKLWAVLSL